MKTFFVQTLGCRVNHYESDQIAELLQSRGLIPASAATADLRVINTCSVTMQAASQSRQSVRRMVKLPVLAAQVSDQSTCVTTSDAFNSLSLTSSGTRPRVLVTGCWATSNPAEAAALAGVDAVLGHHHDIARELDQLLILWESDPASSSILPINPDPPHQAAATEPIENENSLNVKPGKRVGRITKTIEPELPGTVNPKPGDLGGGSLPDMNDALSSRLAILRESIAPTAEAKTLTPALSGSIGRAEQKSRIGAVSLPLLGRRQAGRQRAYLKIQDGCDAHCTYCIIPSLRPNLWSKPIDDAVTEARALVTAGHVEIVLTGIFLGAYGQPTALRRRQPRPTAHPLGELIDALCTDVPGLHRLRLSSLEPGDLTPHLLAILRSHPQMVPHFHLPVQSGSDALLRRMNRQYTRDDFLRMVDGVNAAFDRPALTTDIVVGFPGEDDAEFEETAALVRAAGFIHVHAFPYSPRPGTAAARWTDQFVRGPVVNERIGILRELAEEQGFAFRQSFIGQTMEVIVERDSEQPAPNLEAPLRHGRCERYFPVHFSGRACVPGDAVRVRIDRVERARTVGTAI